MNTEFPPDEFDSWAGSYDQSVHQPGYPFEGYAAVLETVLRQSAARAGMAILDLGAGTGNLSVLFAEQGCRLWCLDFSGPMLEILRAKLPEAATAQVDVRAAWPVAFQRRYDRIVSAYTFHHFPLAEKAVQVERLRQQYLSPGGWIVIGDLAFENAQQQEAARNELGGEWDDEYYWLADETRETFSQMGMQIEFTKVSRLAGVFLVR